MAPASGARLLCVAAGGRDKSSPLGVHLAATLAISEWPCERAEQLSELPTSTQRASRGTVQRCCGGPCWRRRPLWHTRPPLSCIFFRPPLGGRYAVNTRLDSLPQVSRHVHEPNRTQRRPPCPTATTPLAPRLGVCSDQQEDDERLQPQPALFQAQVRPQQGRASGLSGGCYAAL